MNNGITEPKYAILDDGSQVVVKLSRGPEGNLVLFNEYVCYRLAILIDIPMPCSGICVMDENTEVLDPDIASDNNYGYAFYSTFLPKTTTRQWSFAAGEMSGVKKVLFIYDSDFEDSRHDM